MLGEFEGRIDSLMATENGDELVVSFAVSGASKAAVRKMYYDAKDALTRGKERLRIGVDIWREKRSLDANAYFHVLADKIAKATKSSMDEIKKRLVTQYGVFWTNDNGQIAGMSLPEGVSPEVINPYYVFFGQERKNGYIYNKYLLKLPTHLMDREQMARLIEGTIEEAQELGIETATPEELMRMLSLTEARSK